MLTELAALAMPTVESEKELIRRSERATLVLTQGATLFFALTSPPYRLIHQDAM